MAAKVCAAPDCIESFIAKGNKKWCSTTCRNRIASRKFRAQKRREEGRPDRHGVKSTEEAGLTISTEPTKDRHPDSGRRGPAYEAFCRTDLPELVASEVISQGEAAREFDVNKGTLAKWMAAWHIDRAKGKAADEHEPDLSHTDNLGDFTRRYFPDFLIPDFHLEWEKDIDEVVGTGGQLLLLAPQRFGKSEMLIRYCLQRIARDPNISIGWVSKTADLAEDMVGYIRQHLEHNEKFIEDVLGPGATFKPGPRSGYSWTDGEFTVANRTRLRKSPTMKALGVGGTIVGKDFDLIILDDPQDHIRCMSPTQRVKDKKWLFTDFLSRKEDHTGVAFIMSRQHVDDLPGNVIRDHADDWDVRVYQAHDPACPIPDANLDEHVECCLWPEKRTWKWLESKKRANPAHFERNYMNNPKTDSTVLITAEDIDRCKDHERVLGQIPKGVSRLVAGIDPADAKPVAAVLWGYEPSWGDRGRRHIIDIMEAEAGVRGARQILKQWKTNYRCSLFVVEKNIAQSWWQDADIRDLTSDGQAQIKPHYTDRHNKWNEATGVVAMFSKMRMAEPEITIPWGDIATRQKMERLARTFLLFDPDYAGHKHADDDLPMAAWFPQPTMDSWMQETSSMAQVEYPQTGYLTRRTPYPKRTKVAA